MPIYEYQCIQCQVKDERIGGLDDDTALCLECGNLMLRLNEDALRPYFEQPEKERTAREQQVA